MRRDPFMDYNRQHKVKTKIVRIFNTYGPRMHPNDGRVVSNFIVQALQDQDITIYGGGTQTRSFCYVDDLVDGLLKMMATDDEVLGPINLGNPVEQTVGSLAKKIVTMIQSQSKIQYQDIPQDDPKRRRPDISEASRLLDWIPSTDLEVGLRQTIEYFQSKLER